MTAAPETNAAASDGTGDDLVDRTAARHGAMAATVISIAFSIHALNGFVIERLFLGFHSYTDYTDIHKLSDALGSPPWLASGFGHLVTGVAVVVLGVNLSRWMAPTRPRLAEYARYATAVAAVGFTMLGVADLQGSGTVHLLAHQNPELASTANMSLTVLVAVVNGVAISAYGWLMLLVARFTQLARSGLPRWYVWLSYVAGACGLIVGFAYIPAYLVPFLAWSISTAVMLRRVARSAGA